MGSLWRDNFFNIVAEFLIFRVEITVDQAHGSMMCFHSTSHALLMNRESELATRSVVARQVTFNIPLLEHQKVGSLIDTWLLSAKTSRALACFIRTHDTLVGFKNFSSHENVCPSAQIAFNECFVVLFKHGHNFTFFDLW